MVLELDFTNRREFERHLNLAAEELERGFPDAMTRIARVFSQSIDEQFLQSGVPPWNPLAPYTLKKRLEWEKVTGRKLVAGLKTPLRRSDELRKAATATSHNIKGSAFQKTAMSVQVGVDTSILPHASDLNEGDESRNLPAREFMVLSPFAEEKATQIGQEFLDRFGSKWSAK